MQRTIVNERVQKVHGSPLSVQLLGFGGDRIRAALDDRTHVTVTTWEWKDAGKALRSLRASDIWALKLPSSIHRYHEPLREVLVRLRGSAPSVWIPASRHSEPANELAQFLLDQLGARTFRGSRALDELHRSLEDTVRLEPWKIIANAQFVDGTLRVVFGDGATASMPIPAVQRHTENKELRWEALHISPDRSFLTVGPRHSLTLPLPFDIIREYVARDANTRARGNRTERQSTAQAVGPRIRELREHKGITQDDLASRIGKSRWTIIRIESGRLLPSVGDLEKMARAMGVGLAEVLAEEGR
jgi:DNA-binding XRE family transcriptional regulator